MSTAFASRPSSLALGLTLALAAGSFAVPRNADACGGCFAPSQTVQVVTDHRMVMSVQPGVSYLWDQIRYTGDPADFAWVLPVSGDVQIDVAAPEFFDQLANATAIHVQGPVISTTCGGGGGFGAFNAAGAPTADADGGAAMDDGVTVISQNTVGPYDTVTLRSTDSSALTTWLRAHSYDIPTAIEPVIQFYVDRHMDFVAMRLSPGVGVQAMQPVRIRYATANMTLPLRMVSAGVADKVGITLWVFASARMESMNYANATIDPAQLAWNWTTSTSNYSDLFDQTIRNTASGRAWITETSNAMSAYTLPAQGNGTMAAIDWQLASDGGATWITRMRADLAARFLDGDLVMQASLTTTAVPNTLRTTLEIGPRPVPNCPGRTIIGAGGGTGVSCDVAAPGAKPLSWLGAAALTLAAAATALASRRPRTLRRAASKR